MMVKNFVNNPEFISRINNHKHDADIPWAPVNNLRTVFFAQFVTNDLPTNFMGMYIAMLVYQRVR